MNNLRVLFKRALIFQSKTITKMPFYAVQLGKKPGVYTNWSECQEQTVGFHGARFKKFDTEQEALDFVDGKAVGGKTEKKDKEKKEKEKKEKEPTFYAVQLGKKPGVYTSWSECQEQTVGFRGARFKKFDTEEEALDFVKGKAAGGKTEKKEKDAKVTSSTAGSKRKASKDKKSEESGSDSEDAAGTSNKKDEKKRKVAKDDSGEDSSETETKGPAEDDPDAVTVYTDGCCLNNGKDNPNGGVGVYWGPDHPNNLSEKLEGRQTNNRAEIYAALRAIQQAKKLDVKKLIIKTDSSFLVNCQTNWVKKWKKNGWKTSAGADVTNRDELQELDKEEKDFCVTYVHVPAHKGVEGNEAADKLAKAGAKK